MEYKPHSNLLQKGFIQIVSRPSCYFAKVPEIGLQQPKTSQLGVFDLDKGRQAYLAS